MILDPKTKELAIRYVMATGFFKKRLADYLGISRPTLDRILEGNPDFFTQLKAADAVFCKDLVLLTKKKNPTFLLKARYREEFNDNFRIGPYDPEEEIKKILNIIHEASSQNISNHTTVSS